MEKRLGKYSLEEMIAVGGMAEIYRARTQGLGGVEKVVAIKRLHDQYCSDRDFVEMLINEARLAARLNHKNICQVFDLEQEGDAWFIAMEYIHGRDLFRVQRRLLDAGQLLPLPASVYLTTEICSGLSYAHRMTDDEGQPLDIIHRDISPQNVLVSFEGEVKLVDFGIAKAAKRASMTQSGVIKGKFYYMSPEQARGDRIDQRADIFSVGAILYELATGRMLYEGEDDARLVRRVRRADYVAPRTICPDVPRELEQIILKALAREPQQRFQSARDLQLALSGFAHGLGTVFDSVSLSELMHAFFDTGSAAASAVLPVVGPGVPRGERPQGARGGARAPAAGPKVDEEAPTSVYEKDRIQGIIEEIDRHYGAADGQGMRRAEVPEVVRAVDLAVDEERYRVATVVTDRKGRRKGAGRAPMGAPMWLLFIAALVGLVLLAWAFVFATNHLVLGEAKQTSAPRMTVVASADGGMWVASEPRGARIIIDGEDTGLRTPARVVGVSGPRNLSLQAELYEPWAQLTTFAEGGAVEAKLEPRHGALRIVTQPPGAAIYLNGQSVGISPVTITEQPMPEGHRVTASRPGFKDVLQTVQWTVDEPELVVTLVLSPSGALLRATAEALGQACAGGVYGALMQRLPDKRASGGGRNDDAASSAAADRRGYGSLSITSKPPGKIYLDGVSTGRMTPVLNLRVPAGYVRVKVYFEESRSFSGEKRTLVKPNTEVKILFSK